VRKFGQYLRQFSKSIADTIGSNIIAVILTTLLSCSKMTE